MDALANVAVLKRPDDLDRDEWLHRWLVDHTPIAIATQATFGYVQNIVTRELTDVPRRVDALVEELFPSAGMVDMHAFYGSGGDDAELNDRLTKLMASVARIGFDHDIDLVPSSRYVYDLSVGVDAARADGKRGGQRHPALGSRLERLQRRELRVEQRRRHEVSRAFGEPLLEQLLRRLEVKHHQVGTVAAELVPVRAPQRRARHDPASIGQPRADLGQPRPAVLVGQRLTAGHLRDVRRGCSESASRKASPSRSASPAPTVDLPDPDTPITTTGSAGRAHAAVVPGSAGGDGGVGCTSSSES